MFIALKNSRVSSGMGLILMLATTLPCWGQQSVDELAKTLSLMPVAGKSASGKKGSAFILNRNITDGLSIPEDASAANLAKAVGFTGEDGSLAPICLTVPWQKDWFEVVKKLHTEGKLKTVHYLDIGSPVEAIRSVLEEMKQKYAENHQAFVDYLKSQRLEAAALGLNSLEDAKLNFDKSSVVLGLYTQRFLISQAMDHFRNLQLQVVRLQPGLSFGGPYAGDFEHNSDALVLEAWRGKALVPWVADRSWFNGDFSLQSLGYLLSLARASETKNPILCDIHVGSKHYTQGIRRAMYLALGQGAKRIRFVGAVPPSMTRSSENLATDSLEIWKTLRELTHEAGRLESALLDAQPRSPDVGLVVSLNQSLYDDSPWVSEERKAIYLAARRSGHTVAVLTEEDIHDGKFQKISSIFLAGTHLQRETTRVLKSFVLSGASLSCTGGPYLDEYNQPHATMLELMGIKDPSWQQLEKAGPAKKTLANIKPTDSLKYDFLGKTHNFPVVYGKLKYSIDDQYKQHIVEIGKFNDGTLAMHKHEYEPVKFGFVWVFASPLGSGWLKTALPGRAYEISNSPDAYNHKILFDHMDGDAGDVVIAATGDARYDVITDNLAIETILMEKPNGVALVVINWSNKPQNCWLTAQFVPKEMNEVYSVFKGRLNVQRVGVTISLPKRYEVEQTDVIMIE